MQQLSNAQTKSLKSLRWAFVAIIILPPCFLVFGSYLLWTSTVVAEQRDLDWRAEVVEENVSRIFEGNISLLRRVNELLDGLSDAQIAQREGELHRQLLDLVLGVPRVRTIFILNAQGDT